jgi:cystathionine gamma-lyase
MNTPYAKFDTDLAIARMLHHRAATLSPGEPLAPPIVPASIYHVPGNPTAPHIYGRWSNPTWSAVEDALAVLEGAETVAFPSGMAAIASVLCSQLKNGDRLLLPSDGYFNTRVLADRYLTPVGVKTELCCTTDYERYDFSGLHMVFVETPSNPGLDICDLRSVISRAKAAGALVVADNTTMTPLGQRPLDLGADIVVASDTKAPNGHSDVLFGHVSTRQAELAQQIRDWRKLVGAIPGQFEAWLVHRGLETLDVRFERMCKTASVLAERMAEHPAITKLRYPGLSSHPAHDLARSQMQQFGTLIGITFADEATAERFITEARFIHASTSFGGVHTTAERRARWGDQVAPGYIRLSVGCEPTEVLWADMREVLAKLH